MEAAFEFLKQKEFLAPWLQAILSALAILIAYELGLKQARNQHRSALRVAKEEHRLKALTFLQTVLAIVEQADLFFTDALNDDGWVLVSRVSQFDSVSIKDIVASISAIPLHELPLPIVATELIALRQSLRVLSLICDHIPSMTKGMDRSEGDAIDLSQLVSPIRSGQASVQRIKSEIEIFSRQDSDVRADT